MVRFIEKTSFISVLMVVLIITGCASSPSSSSSSGGRQPQWMTDINSVYPDSDYLAVLGAGDSLNKAQSKAASNLALIFENRIVVDSTIESRYVEMRQGGALSGRSEETSINDTISQLSDQTLQNVKYGESWTDNMGTVTVVAYLNRKETAELYRTRMADQSDSLNRLVSEGDNSNSLIERYGYYDSAFVIAMANEVMREQLEIISPSTARMAGMGYDLAEIKSARTDATKDMTFSMDFSGDTEGVAQAALTTLLTDMGFTVANRSELKATGSLRSEKIDRNNDYQNYKWYLTLEIVDESGLTILTVDESAISASTSDSAALSRLNRDVEEVIKKEFRKQFGSYLNSFVNR